MVKRIYVYCRECGKPMALESCDHIFCLGAKRRGFCHYACERFYERKKDVELEYYRRSA